jgi:hypothetical protein
LKISSYLLFTTLIFSQLTFAESNSCRSVFATGNIIRKAHYLAMNRYEKQSVLKNVFRVGSDLNPRFQGYDNLSVSNSFKVYGIKDESIDSKLQSAALKVFKKYELDSRENTVQLVATVLFEGKEVTLSENNPWAVLISKRIIDARGRVKLEPVSAYSIEKTGASETIVPIIHNFDSLII